MSESAGRLFLYGTLMPGQTRWEVLQGHALSSEPARATGQLWDTGEGYPAARFDSTGQDIPGVLVSIAPDALPDVIVMLDRIEGEGVLFRRVEVLTTGGKAIGYEWIGSTDGFVPLEHGWAAQ